MIHSYYIINLISLPPEVFDFLHWLPDLIDDKTGNKSFGHMEHIEIYLALWKGNHCQQQLSMNCQYVIELLLKCFIFN